VLQLLRPRSSTDVRFLPRPLHLRGHLHCDGSQDGVPLAPSLPRPTPILSWDAASVGSRHQLLESDPLVWQVTAPCRTEKSDYDAPGLKTRTYDEEVYITEDGEWGNKFEHFLKGRELKEEIEDDGQAEEHEAQLRAQREAMRDSKSMEEDEEIKIPVMHVDESRSCLAVMTTPSGWLPSFSDTKEQDRLNAQRAKEMSAFLSVPTLQVHIKRIETGLMETAECVGFEPVLFLKMRLAVRLGVLTTDYVKDNLPKHEGQRIPKHVRDLALTPGSYAQCIKLRFTEEYQAQLDGPQPSQEEKFAAEAAVASPWACEGLRSHKPVAEACSVRGDQGFAGLALHPSAHLWSSEATRGGMGACCISDGVILDARRRRLVPGGLFSGRTAPVSTLSPTGRGWGSRCGLDRTSIWIPSHRPCHEFPALSSPLALRPPPP
jgi:hypothetical protein